MYVNFSPKLNDILLPLVIIDAGYQKLIKEYDTNCWPFYQFVCCFQGQAIYHVEGHRITLIPGTVIFMKPGVRHHYSTVGDACYVSWVSFEGYLMEKICYNYGLNADEHYTIIQDCSHPNLHLEIMSIIEQAVAPFALDRISTIIYKIAVEYFLQLRDHPHSYKTDDKQEKTIIAAIEFMKTHIQLPPNISALAGELSISRQHLCRLFQQKFGITTKEYWTKLKILQSQKDLVELSEKTVKEIALDLGFINTSHFTKVFKQVTGVTPNSYRASYFS